MTAVTHLPALIMRTSSKPHAVMSAAPEPLSLPDGAYAIIGRFKPASDPFALWGNVFKWGGNLFRLANGEAQSIVFCTCPGKLLSARPIDRVILVDLDDASRLDLDRTLALRHIVLDVEPTE